MEESKVADTIEPALSPTQINISEAEKRETNNKKKLFKKILFAILIIVVILVIHAIADWLGVYTLFQKPENTALHDDISMWHNSPQVPSFETPANWKTYTSTPGAYKISYPPDYTINTGHSMGVDGVITVESDSYTELISTTIPTTNENMKISIDSKLTDYKTIDDVASSDCADAKKGRGEVYERLDGAPSLIYRNINCGPRSSTKIYTINSGRAYSITVESNIEDEKIRPIYSDILLTFKFAPSKTLDTSDWKTYTNAEFGFSFKYPSKFTIKEVRYYDAEGNYRNKLYPDVYYLISFYINEDGKEGYSSYTFIAQDYAENTISQAFKDIKTIPITKPNGVDEASATSHQLDSGNFDTIYRIGNKYYYFEPTIQDSTSREHIWDYPILSTIKFTK
ncbi:MAG TPA: hypothetical protein VG965_04050 [Patescibacteria group bacterium]|nr:hypothetical protein [Patescibacteria group bacterium]